MSENQIVLIGIGCYLLVALIALFVTYVVMKLRYRLGFTPYPAGYWHDDDSATCILCSVFWPFVILGLIIYGLWVGVQVSGTLTAKQIETVINTYRDEANR
ncbi:hypothetical protein D3I60_00040 [Brevibacterium permense]|uniref:hypothetical protein n=1 Tax=Brevibacterium permense TaxID=234834 RepID=UPI0021CE957E|nr:hypothetical protein [Brevibacterium permense]MCU4295486.1 hypothetical protein [Brevibacterium permense]